MVHNTAITCTGCEFYVPKSFCPTICSRQLINLAGMIIPVFQIPVISLHPVPMSTMSKETAEHNNNNYYIIVIITRKTERADGLNKSL